MICIGFIAYFVVKSEISALLILPRTSLNNILNVMSRVFIKLVFYITLFVIILAIADFIWEKYQYIKKLKMTKQEVKDEYKQLEGDPQIKGHQKKIQYQII